MIAPPLLLMPPSSVTMEAFALILAYIQMIRTVPNLRDTVADMHSITDNRSSDAERIAAMKRLARSPSFLQVLEHLREIGNVQDSFGQSGEETQVPARDTSNGNPSALPLPSRSVSDSSSSLSKTTVNLRLGRSGRLSRPSGTATPCSTPGDETRPNKRQMIHGPRAVVRMQEPEVIVKQENADGLDEQLGLSDALREQAILAKASDVTVRSAPGNFGGQTMQCTLGQGAARVAAIAGNVRGRGEPCDRCRQQRKKVRRLMHRH